MKSVDPGILPQSVCFPFTPSDTVQELFFYPTWCGHYYCTNSYFLKRDSYPPLLVAYIRAGRMRVEFRGEVIMAERGDVILLDCVEPHYYHAENNLEFVYMHFDGSNAHALSQHIMKSQGWVIRRENNMVIGKLLYDMVRRYEAGDLESDMERSMRIYSIFELLLSPTTREREAASPVGDAIAHIRANVGKPITLEELAEVARLSPYYFSHCFKKQTGFSPKEYVINIRMERAKILLARTNKSIAEIAYEVGYHTSGSLINLFMKRVGLSPKQYRMQHQSTYLQHQQVMWREEVT